MAKKTKTVALDKARGGNKQPNVVHVHHKRRWSMLIPAFSILLLVFAISLAIYSRYFTYSLNEKYGIESPSLTDESSSDVASTDLGYVTEGSLGDVATSSEQLIVKTGAYTVSVDVAEDAVDAIEQVAEDLGGTVASSQVFHDVTRCDYAMPLLESAAEDVAVSSYPYGCQAYNAVVSIRVPSAKFQDAEDAVATVDENEVFDEEQTSETDVTDATKDLEARLVALKAEESALLELLDQAAALDDVLKIRTELTSIRTQIESYETQLESINKDVDMSQLTVYVRELTDAVTTERPSVSARFEIAWEAMKQDLSGIGTGLIYIAVYALIYVPIFVLVLLVIWLASRFVHKHNK